MRLKVHQVTTTRCVRAFEEVLEAHFKDFGCRCVAGDMSAEIAIGLVSANHHSQRVPAQDSSQTLLDRQIARIATLRLQGNAIPVGRIWPLRGGYTQLLGMDFDLFEQELDTLVPVCPHQPIKRLQPLLRFGRINITGVVQWKHPF
ncbi:hypothetical protein D3C76_1388750 [compost metagenome]